ncbi:MAG: RIP metalloprotease RseP [Acidobacteria bacterium]|nr:RIP metalloprotease RseP [Acidobacteriota bacterium]MDA1236870.1 RIP metalloprotease RseP [Acidobacteriota bacterium]
MGFLENSLAFLFVLGVLVLIHELGHHLAARYFGVRVESFSIGFGPRLFGFRYGETDYKVCLLPLGGYVKMAGVELVGDSIGSDDAQSDSDGFLAKPRWQRLIVLLMGPLFNVILAVALLAGMYMAHFERLKFWTEPAVVGYVQLDSAAKRAGVEAGDLILSVNGELTENWQDATLAVISATNSTVPIEVERNGNVRSLSLAIGADEQGLGRAGWTEVAPVRIGQISPGLPAAKANIQPGDLLTAINGEPMAAVEQVIDSIRALGGNQVELTLNRDGQDVTASLTAVYDDSDAREPAWRIGVELMADNERIVTPLSFGEALRQSIDDNRKNATLIFSFLGGLVEQRFSSTQLSGPVGIAQMSGEAARRGWPELIGLMAGISLNLGIFNLLPIPILDGGSILMLLFESVMRRDVSLVVKERILQAGLVFIVLLFAFVMYNDILKALPQS